MHFSYSDKANRSKAGKFALVAGLHVAVGVLFVHSLNTRHLSLSILPEQVLVLLHPDPPAPPAQPPMPTMPTLAPPPPIVVPEIEVDVAPPPDPAPLLASTAPDLQPAQPAAAVDPAPQPGAPPASANPGQMHTAVLADAKGCALPAYPSNAARNGDTGTTTLALLVGADGRVSSARVEHTSGSRELDRAALQALSLCKFKPATSNGVPEAAWARLAYVWTLD